MGALQGKFFGARRVRWSHCSVGTAALAAVLSTPAAAQSAPQPIPPTREEVRRDDPTALPPPGPRLEIEGGVERAPCALDNPDFANIRFTPRAFVFEGLKGVTPQELVPAYAPILGQEQPVAVLCDVRDRAATILRQAGYLASVEVPEQRIADGTVRFRVLMAKLVDVRVRGEASGAERAIAGYLRQLTGQDVFNRYEAERYLLLASDIPGYNVRLTLRPAGTVPGEVVGDVTVLRTPAWVDANIQNYGSKELGRWGGLVRAQLFGLTGLADRTTATFFTTADLEEQQTVQLGHDFRLGSEGLAVGGTFTYAWARPDLAGDDSDILAETLFATAEVSYPFLRRQSRTLRGSLGMDFINQDTEIDDLDISRDRLRIAFARLNADAMSSDFTRTGFSIAEPVWRTSALMEVRRGLDIFGASERCRILAGRCVGPSVSPVRIEGDPTATVLRGSLYGEYRPAPKFTMALGLRGQYSDDPLPSFEEFSAGNYTVGRGYDPGTLLGDSGIGLQAELRVGSVLPVRPRAVAAEPYIFFDYARVSNEDRLTVQEGSRDLSSLGAGVRAGWDRFRIDTVLAFPLQRAGVLNEQQDFRLLISLTTRLWPWSFQ